MAKRILSKKKQEAAHTYYRDALLLLNESKIPYLLAGAFALKTYTGISRNTKDLDIFCKEVDYVDVLKVFAEAGFKTEITDPRWIAKSFKKDFYIDIIFSNTSNICRVDDSWFDHAKKGKVLDDVPVKIIAAEDLIWSKIYIKNRERYDGADVNHLILKYGKKLDWDRLKDRMKEHWHLLLGQILNFLFVYPGERDIIPKKLFKELMEKASQVYDLPLPQNKVCRGPLLDHTSYKTDIVDWGYVSLTSFSV